MTTFKRFEDMRVWQSARVLVKSVYSATTLPNFRRDFGLRDQIRRAAVSVMSNIAEGFGAGSDAEFVRFLGFARRSNSEAQSQLYAALDQHYISEDEFQKLYSQANEIERQINTLIAYLGKTKNTKGNLIKETQGGYILTIPDDLNNEQV